MIVVFNPPAQHIQQIAWACRDAGIDYAKAAQPVPSIACEFDDSTQLITWHSEFGDVSNLLILHQMSSPNS
jgi:hypothetical protein